MSDEESGTPEQSENEREHGMALDLFDEQASERVRRVWHEGRWFFSVIDVVAVLTGNHAQRAIGRTSSNVPVMRDSVNCTQNSYS